MLSQAQKTDPGNSKAWLLPASPPTASGDPAFDSNINISIYVDIFIYAYLIASETVGMC